MNQILIGNSYCRLQGFSEEALDVVEDSISYVDEDKILEANELSKTLRKLKKFYQSREDSWEEDQKRKFRYRLHKMEQALYTIEDAIDICFLEEDNSFLPPSPFLFLCLF